jgi:hypothetical protein
MSMKKSTDTIGNRTSDLSTCRAVPQPTALPRTPIFKKCKMKISRVKTEVKVCSKDHENVYIKMDDDALKQVKKFKYLCSIFTEDGKNKEDMIQRVEEAKVICLIIKSNYSVRITLVWKKKKLYKAVF